MAATPAASVIVQLHYVRSESLYRLVPSVTQLKWTEAGYDVSSVSLTVSHVSGASTASLAYADWSKHGLSVSRIIKMPGQQPLPGVVMTSGTWTLGKSRYDYIQFQLKKDNVVIDTVTIGVYSDGGKGDTGDAAVSYEMMLSPDNLHFDADGGVNYDVKVTAYKVTGGTRTLVKSNTDGVGFLCLYGTKSDGTAVVPNPIQSTTDAVEISSVTIKKELLVMYIFGARNIELRLQDTSANPLAVKSIPILRDGGRGLTGATSVPPGLWDEYGDEYEFQDGVTAADGVTPATRLDTVALLNGDNSLNLYMCVHSHKKKDGIKDSKGNLLPPNESSYWKASETQGSQFISTRVFLSDGAYIGLMSTNGIQLWETLADGTRQVVGEIIGGSAREHDYTIWIGGYKDDDGIVYPQWAVDGYGTHYFGSKSGQRIELSPSEKMIKVYEDADRDPCLVINGNRISSPSEFLGSGNGSVTTKATSGTSATATQTIAEVTAVEGKTITVTVGEVNLKASSYYPILSSSGTNPDGTIKDEMVMKTSTVTFCLAAVKSGGTEIVASVERTFTSTAMPPLNAVRGSTYTYEKAYKNLRLSLGGLEGDYTIKVIWTLTTQHNTPPSGSWSGLKSAVPAAVTDYKARFGANHMLISRSADNYMAVYEDSSAGIVTEMVNGLYGLRLTSSGLQARVGTSRHFESMPLTLFRGALYFAPLTQPIFGNAKYVHTFDGQYDGMTAEACTTGGVFRRNGNGVIEVDLTTWKTNLGASGLNWGNLFVRGYVNGNQTLLSGFNSDYTKLTLKLLNASTGSVYEGGAIVQCEIVYYP